MFRDPHYLSFCAASFLVFCGMLTPYILAATYSFTMVDGYERCDLARLVGSSTGTSDSIAVLSNIGNARDTAFYTVAIINTGNLLGRIIPAILSDLGVMPGVMILACTIVLAIFGYAWIAIKERAGYVAFLVLYSFFSGGVASLPGVALPYLCPALDVFATRLGFVYSCAGLGVLIGTPIATAIDARVGADYQYLGSPLWVGATMTVAIFFVAHATWAIERASHAVRTAGVVQSATEKPDEKEVGVSGNGHASEARQN